MRCLRIFMLICFVAALGSAAEHEAEHEKLVEPVIVELDAMTVVGIQTLFSMKCNLIPVLWERFASRMQEIENVARENVALEVSYDMQGEVDEQTFFVLTGLIVSSVADVPEGMTYKHIPAHRYALFIHYGPISQIYDTYDCIYNKLLPRSAYEVDEQACTIEWYDERFKMDSPDSEYDIYVPVKERNE
jgi:AraC family transcriptional regulator